MNPDALAVEADGVVRVGGPGVVDGVGILRAKIRAAGRESLTFPFREFEAWRTERASRAGGPGIGRKRPEPRVEQSLMHGFPGLRNAGFGRYGAALLAAERETLQLGDEARSLGRVPQHGAARFFPDGRPERRNECRAAACLQALFLILGAEAGYLLKTERHRQPFDDGEKPALARFSGAGGGACRVESPEHQFRKLLP